MKIKLTRTGGFIPITKVAEEETNFSEEELLNLVESVKADPDAPRIKDGNNWELSIAGTSTIIDPEKIPDEFRELFDKLRGNLKISGKES